MSETTISANHSTNDQSFKYFIDFKSHFNGTEIKLEIPINKYTPKQKIDLSKTKEEEEEIVEHLVNDYLSDNYKTNTAIEQYLDYYHDGDNCDNCEESYTIRKELA